MKVSISKHKVLSLLEDLNMLLNIEKDYINVNTNEKTENLLLPLENGLKEIESIVDTLYRIIEWP